MPRAVPFVVIRGDRLDDEPVSSTNYLDGRRRADRVMAELTMAFAHDAAAAAVAEETALAKWPTGWTLAFVISTSAALWAMIAGFVYFI